MSKPAGVQLSRWFTYMVLLLLFVNVAAVAGSILIYRSVHAIAAKYQPFFVATSAVEQHIISAQRDMFEYLSELTDSPEAALKQLDALSGSIEQARAVAPTPEAEATLTEIKSLADRYRVAIEQLPAAMSGSRDWTRMKELGGTAARYGGEVAKKASDLASWAQAEIRGRNDTSSTITTLAMATFIVVLLASVGVILALLHWWKRFQDLILGI
jgi:hypothetical protein